MKYLKNIRKAYCLKQSEMAELLNLSRPHYTMIEREKRRPDIEQRQRLECLVRYHDQAQNNPNEKLLKSLDQKTQDEIYRSLIDQSLELEAEIEKQNEAKRMLLEKHATLKLRLLALQMIESNLEEHPWFQSEQRSWLDVQLRVAKQEFSACKLSDINLIDILIIGLYTQLDHTRILLQSGKLYSSKN